MKIWMIMVLLVVLVTPWGPARAESDQHTIVFGQSAALTGPARALGIGMRLGLRAAFSEVNRKGGVHGRLLQLESLDDRYEPEAAIANTRTLIEQNNVFALIGAVGTPTSKSAQPVATEAGIPYIAPFTGAEFLRDAKKRPNVVNVRASYYQETEEMVVRLHEDLGIDRISIFYQNDSFGQAGLNGLRRAVNRHGLNLIEEVYYTRNTEAVKIALLDLRQANAEAVIIVGAYKPAATMIRWARRLNFNPYFINISFIGSAALAKALGPDGTGVYVTQVVPFPRDRTLPIVAQYRKALKAIDANSTPSFVSLEGYLAGRIAIEGLRLAGPAPTRDSFLRALTQAGNIDLGGFYLRYGVDDNQGSDRVYLTRIDKRGRFQSVKKMSAP
jgi:ABC-type branched-subunit amino acid transport system substrate-binding protein